MGAVFGASPGSPPSVAGSDDAAFAGGWGRAIAGRAQVLEQHAAVGVELVEAPAVRHLGQCADGVADAERGFVVRPRVRGAGDAVVLDELVEDR